MSKNKVVLTPTGELVYVIGISIGLSVLFFGVLRLFAYAVVGTAKLFGLI